MSTPAAIMRKAYDSEMALWDLRFCISDAIWRIVRSGKLISETRDRSDFDRLSGEAGHRAALRALAAMEPTPKMSNASAEILWADGIATSKRTTDGMAKAFNLAAASEGEKL